MILGSPCDLPMYRELEGASEHIPDHATLLLKSLEDSLFFSWYSI